MEQKSSVRGQWRSLPFLSPFPPPTSGTETYEDGALPTSQFVTELYGTEITIPLTTEAVNELPQGEALGAVAAPTPGDTHTHTLSLDRQDPPLHMYMRTHTHTNTHTCLWLQRPGSFG